VSEDPETACARCDRTVPTERLDGSGWCAECRETMVRRATLAARAAVVVVAVALILVLFALLRASPQFLVLWIVLVLGACFVLFNVVRRVTFELFRARSVGRKER
jgi:hypothetical protein